jgi:hypothetical protein
MPKRVEGGIVLLSIILLAFIAGVVNLLVLRFDAGDAYPVYSSLRSDPLGTKIFYESLGALDGFSVGRNYRPISKLDDRTGTTVFYFGAPPGLVYLDEDEASALEALPAVGNRLVFLFRPVRSRRPPQDEKKAGPTEKKTEGEEKNQEGKKGGGKKEGPIVDGDDDAGYRVVSLQKRWKFGTNLDELPDKTEPVVNSSAGPISGPSSDPTAAPSTGAKGLSDSISWHSTLYFDQLGDEWKTIYAREGHPVVIERPFGRGTIVLSTDTFFVSNEAMRRERHPDLLAWLVGPSRSAIFDETHFGIEENPGVAALGRKYRLQIPFASILFLAFLFIWKNAFSLVPPYTDDEEGRGNLSMGKDYLSGFAGLLGRTIPPRDVLSACREEWEKTGHRGSKGRDEALQQIRSLVEEEKGKPAGKRNPVNAYNRIISLLSERNVAHEQEH